ncbi:MAG: hypothetical protein DMD84_02010 [Candidatus Rokuibacteriota bacterium]|nr:MAG: hypothetical protein DMD84_02010 [Candidatus Rokubacteria bacterium]
MPHRPRGRRTALTAAIDELPATYRSVLVLRDVEGRSNLEIAQALGLSVPVVKTRVHRARLFLRKRLGGFMTTMDGATAIAYAS